MNKGVNEYNNAQETNNKDICELLAHEITKALPGAENKVWHGAPVWFLDGNPIVGYWVRKNYVQLLFWSGQSFHEPGLSAEGSFKAAEARYSSLDEIDQTVLAKWLEESKQIQWDYKNIVKRRGKLEKLKL